MVTLGQPVSNELELCSMLFLFSKSAQTLGLPMRLTGFCDVRILGVFQVGFTAYS